MGLLNTINSLFTWWNGQTVNFRLWSWRKGVKVGQDSQGNQFYRSRDSVKRWVMFNGEAEASRIDPDWHGWLHHTWDQPPSEAPLVHRAWERPHEPNLTGSPQAYAPAGSIRRADPAPRRDYEAWQPE